MQSPNCRVDAVGMADVWGWAIAHRFISLLLPWGCLNHAGVHRECCRLMLLNQRHRQPSLLCLIYLICHYLISSN